MNDARSIILCVGLFPALQRTLELAALNVGGVSRIRSVTVSTGGKAVNSARVLQTLGNLPMLFGFSGGDSGRTLERLMAEEGLAQCLVKASAPVRLCQTLLADNVHDFTELVEEGPALPAADWQSLQCSFDEMLACKPVSMIILAGSVPASAPTAIYANLLASASSHGVPCLLDTSGPALLKALPQRPAWVKINMAELFASVGRPCPQDHLDTAVEAAARELIACGAQTVGITHGGEAAWLVTPTALRRFTIPTVPVASTLGCGDAVNAGIAHARQQGQLLEDAFVFGLACGMSNATHRMPGHINPSQIPDLVGKSLSINKPFVHGTREQREIQRSPESCLKQQKN